MHWTLRREIAFDDRSWLHSLIMHRGWPSLPVAAVFMIPHLRQGINVRARGRCFVLKGSKSPKQWTRGVCVLTTGICYVLDSTEIARSTCDLR
ncbi:hypothetical protein CY34DRAFT_798327 [Suillus luteus UH-Slu-Lm8-n1]|uniref:Uncharacterized protein n=1 Tax=Suillus luteus UH-Slu-Lm8-n1 TaxID=930992 RepID=A0A0D0ADB1_9AGAM|nr:hypothetical protein CY34DRAFT_798327 [Suillus luteus UH-Slu-Lm8-n1]